MISKENLLEALAKEDLQVLMTAYLYAKTFIWSGEDVTRILYTATENAATIEKAYRKGYYDAMKRMSESEEV